MTEAGPKTIKFKPLNGVLERVIDPPGREILKYVGVDGESFSQFRTNGGRIRL